MYIHVPMIRHNQSISTNLPPLPGSSHQQMRPEQGHPQCDAQPVGVLCPKGSKRSLQWKNSHILWATLYFSDFRPTTFTKGFTKCQLSRKGDKNFSNPLLNGAKTTLSITHIWDLETKWNKYLNNFEYTVPYFWGEGVLLAVL